MPTTPAVFVGPQENPLLVEAVERVTGRPVPHVVAPRRPGDPARVVADASRIGERLGWRARRGLDELVAVPAPLSGRRA